jgi:ABC-2 type transport system ATP-binding protein
VTAASPPQADRSPTALTVRGLRKAFGPKVAVAGIDLDIPHGCFFGLVGPNGAGKTTTLGMVTGLLRPDAGQVLVDGIEVWRDPAAAKRRIGVLPEDLRLFERLCDRVGIMHLGRLIAEGPTERVRAGRSLEDAFVELVGAGGTAREEQGWLGTSSA